MNRSTLAKRYAPLAAVIAIQLLLIATVPSTGQRSGSNVAAGSPESSFVDESGTTVDESGVVTDAAGNVISGGTSGGTARGTGGATTGGTTAKATPGQPPGVPAGSTAHCVEGRQFDPAIAYWAPPCVPGEPGGAFKNNGGKTYRGVSGTEIVIVDYITNYGAEVNAILEAQGNLIKYEDAKVFDKAIETFINSKYQLYGRKLKIIPYQGQCQSVPPDKQCLLPEMDRIINTYNPYAVFWPTTLCSECFARLAQKEVIAFGGIGFSDEFSTDNAPYIWSAGMSSTKIQQLFAEWWCGQMSSKNVPSRVVKYAGTNNSQQNFNGRPRELGVISTNDPDNQNTVKQVLYKELDRRCGEKVTHEYFYEQDINTAATQVQAGIAAMDTPTNPATTVLCLCDSVAPAFVYQGEQNNNYHPENVLGDVQNMGYDNLAQAYGSPTGTPSLACPRPQQGCNFDNALGIADSYDALPPDQMEGPKIFKIGSNGATAPKALTPFTATNLARSWIMMSNLIQNTGPALTPANMRARSLSLPAFTAPGKPTLRFVQGSYNWAQDVRAIWWNKNRVSPYNNVKGAYVNMGTRYTPGTIPSMPGGPDAPTVPNRV